MAYIKLEHDFGRVHLLWRNAVTVKPILAQLGVASLRTATGPTRRFVEFSKNVLGKTRLIDNAGV